MDDLIRLYRVTLLRIASLFSVTVMLGTAGILRLLAGPVDIPVPQTLIDRVLAETAPDWKIRVDGAEFDFSSPDKLNGLKLKNVVFADKAGRDVLNVPAMGMHFAITPSLDPVKILTVREVALNGASLDIIRDSEGAFTLSLDGLSLQGNDGQNKGSHASFPDLAGLVNLPSLRIEDANIRYSDQGRGTVWQTEYARFTLAPVESGVIVTLNVAIDNGIGGAQVSATHNTDSGEIKAHLTLQDVLPSEIAKLDPLFSGLAEINAPLSGSIDISADDNGSVGRIAGSFDVRSGTVIFADRPEPVEAFSAGFDCDLHKQACALDHFALVTPDVHTKGHGILKRHENGGLFADVTLAGSKVSHGDMEATLNSGSFRIYADSGFDRTRIERIRTEGLALTGLADGMTLGIDTLKGGVEVDTKTRTIKSEDLEAQAITLSDHSGNRHRTAGLKAALTADTALNTLRINSFEATALESVSDALSVQSARISGQATADFAKGVIFLPDMVLNDTQVREASEQPSVFKEVRISGRADVSSGLLEGGTISIRDAAISLPLIYPAPLQINSAQANIVARHTESVTRLSLQNAEAVIDGITAQLQGKLALRSDRTVAGKIAVSFDPLDITKIPQYWPPDAAPGGLRWFSANVKAGKVDSLSIHAQFDEARPERDALDLRFAFRDGHVTYVPHMPPIVRGRGAGRVTLDRLDVMVSDAQVHVPGAGHLAIGGSRFSISDFEPDIPDGEVQLNARGHVQSILRLLDGKPINAFASTMLDINRTDGTADISAMLTLPLANDLLIEDVQFNAQGKIQQYALAEPQTGLTISGGLLEVKATSDGLVLQSDANIGGLSARLGYAQGFARPKPGEAESTVTVETTLTSEDLARHGLDTNPYISGHADVKARVEIYRDDTARISAEADLTDLLMNADPLGWRKAQGVPASLRLSGALEPDGTGRINALTLRGPDMFAEGRMNFSGSGEVAQAYFDRIQLGSAVNTALVYKRNANGRFAVTLDGTHLDLRKAFDSLYDEETELPQRAGQKRPIQTPAHVDTVSLKIGRIMLRDDLSVFNLNGSLKLNRTDLHAADLSGNLNGSAPAELKAEQRLAGMAVRLSAPDAGAFIRATDLFTGAYDGKLVLDVFRRDSVSPVQTTGRIYVTDMIVHDGPALQKILSGRAVGGFFSDLAAGGIKFSKIELPFRGTASQWRINEGVAYGPQLGLTLNGSYKLATRDLDLNGSVSPAYAINGALGNIPVLGSLLTGGEGQGVFGVTFSVNGTTEQPAVKVNPLSALTPGILRRIVSGDTIAPGSEVISEAGIDK